MNEELLKRLDALAEKLGTTGEKVWEILLLQARVDAAFSLLWAISCFAAVYVCWRVGKFLLADDGGDMVRVPVLIGTIALVAGLLNLSDTRWYFMPEAYAIKEILGAIK